MTAAPDVLIAREELQERLRALGAQLSQAYAHRPQPPIFVGVLKGSSIFLADLLRTMAIDVLVDFMAISSYQHGTTSSGVVRILKDVEQPLEERDVVIVEDIVDTGFTLHYLRKTLGARRPASLRAITLLDKVVRRIVPVPLEWSGFEIPDVYVIGYGIDHGGLYRNLDQIYAAPDLPQLAAEPGLYVPTLFKRSDGGDV